MVRVTKNAKSAKSAKSVDDAANTLGSAERRLAGFIDEFESAHRTLIRRVRQALRKRFPAANELVYDNYNFFVIGYSPTERPSDALLSLVAGANGVSLCFIRGATLTDADGLLSGGGKQTRFLRIASASDVRRPGVEALIEAADRQAGTPMPTRGAGRLIIRSVSAKRRPRRKAAT